MADASRIDPVILLEDAAVPGHWVDELGLRPFSEVLASAAASTRGPFTIGIYAKWGTGKTSILKQIRSLLAKQWPDVISIWFNAWQFDQDAHPVVPLALAIAEEIDRRLDADAPSMAVAFAKGLRKTAALLRSIAYGTSIEVSASSPRFPLLPGAEAKIKVSGEKLLDSIDTESKKGRGPLVDPTLHVRVLQQLGQALDKAWEPHLAVDEPPRIVVFVDDLDRCLPTYALRVLQSLKFAFEQPGFVHVLALDRSILKDLLVKRYADLGAKDPEECGSLYIDKIVQLPFHLPSHHARFSAYIDRLVRGRKALQANPDVARVVSRLKDSLTAGAGATPRSLVRTINNLIVDRHLWDRLHGSVSENLLVNCAVSRLVRQILRENYDKLSEDDDLCKELLDGLQDGSAFNVPSELAGSPESGRSLRDSSRMLIYTTLERTPSLVLLLRTEEGRAWLGNAHMRGAVDRFISVNRPDSPAEGVVYDPIEQEIRRSLGLKPNSPITAAECLACKRLDLSHTSVGDADLERVAALTNLSSLDLRYTEATDAGLEHLGELRNLSSLDLMHTQTTDAGLEHLVGLTSLSSLDLSNTQITDAGLEHVAGLKNLSSLDLMNTQVTGAGLERLAGLTNLSRLYLSNTETTDEGLKHLAGLMNLSHLDLMSTRITDAGLKHLAALKNLSTLFLSNTRLTDTGLQHLAQLTTLSRLDLMNTQITSAGLEHLAGLTNLSSLDLMGTQVTDAGLGHLAGLPNLSSLDLMNTQITDAGLECLGRLTKLSRLDLRNTATTDVGLAHLTRLPNPSSLDLVNTQTTASGLDAFRQVHPDCRLTL